MENTKQNYITPSFRTVTVGVRKVMCGSPYGIDDMNYENLGEMDD